MPAARSVRPTPPITAISARRASSTAISTAWRAPISARNIRDDEIAERLTAAGARFTRLTREQTIEQTAQALADEKAVGWMQGRMEFGPRSLGARSILGDARSPSMQKTLNLKVKYRESFRPFAPAVLREDVGEYFDIKTDSPYMLMVAPVNEDRRRAMSEAEEALFGIDKLNVPRSDIPAVTHVDYSARIQTVHKETNPAFHDLSSRSRPRPAARWW